MRKNWAGNLTYRAAELAEPASVDEARELIARSRSIRVLGTRHCFNDIADTAGTQLSLAGLPPVIEVTEARDAVRVAGALRYGDLAPVLEAQGLALANLASLPHISIAGAVATGTHGSGDRTGSLASAVRAVSLLTADGGVRTVTRGEADFDGVVVSLGALGAVLDVTLDLQPSVPYAQHVFEHPRWDAVLEDLDAVTSAGTSVSIFSTWQRTDDADQIWVKQAQPDATRDEREAVMARLSAAAATHRRHPILSEPAEAATEQDGVPGPWFLRLPHFRMDFTPSAGAEIQSEYLVPRADAVAAIEAVRAMADRIAPLLLVNEIRTVQEDDLWLSSSYGTDAVGLHFTWRPDEPSVRALLPELEAALPSSARPHWGKVFTLPGDEVRARYPRWDDFAQLRDRLDPERKFVNDYLERFGL
ncbi:MULTISPECIES: D-arabinono-1,4-lactone oxidase [unclassified Microbacterium]|uniref:D-arabinono-1,4-lactone oxidase n=1 Tax=unclassified Microbacterium TaxID=2609290 RepID=UPI001DD4B36D|nr:MULTISPECIES: D-arabinono-1,4-lactone oxidase [unclassified Microbacterium]CAH0126437.1 putative xylitol oxidase [Microbacterium sp. Bi121]HWK77033.1 D-arabinono-1,4-lactone oxidase [Microbacterium sp.]